MSNPCKVFSIFLVILVVVGTDFGIVIIPNTLNIATSQSCSHLLKTIILELVYGVLE